ncbi:BamA/TamA family outer membrane protein, partial [bacterium]|nr:BamA/TamA family outer membrane protein [bacterium]
LANDEKAISQMGYFYQVKAVKEETPQGFVVTFIVLENPFIKDIKVDGITVFTQEEVLSWLKTGKNQVLNLNTLRSDLDNIVNRYREKGYIAVFTREPEVTPDGTLILHVTEMKIGDIIIKGLKKTKPVVVERFIRSKKGNLLNMNTLADDRKRIFDLGLFENVVIDLQPGATEDTINVIFDITETKTGQVMVGLGYSAQQGLVGRAEVVENNFRGMAEGVHFLWEVGGYTSKRSYELGYYKPWIDKKNTSFNVSLYDKVLYRWVTEEASSRYDEFRKGITTSFERPLSDTRRGAITLRREDASINPEEGSGLPILGKVEGKVTAARFSYYLDTRDIRRNPKQGYYHIYSMEIGHSTSFFSKQEIDIRRYKPFGRKKQHVLAMRLDVATAYGSIPAFEFYTVGGADSLRGYREDRFWGDKMALLSLEWRIPLEKAFYGAVFVDCGSAWGGKYSTESKFSPHLGVGLGLRFETPLGPIRLDYAIGSEGPRTHFSIGHPF